MKVNYFNLIIFLQSAKSTALPFWVNSLSQRAALRMNSQIFQLLSQGHRGRQVISYWVGRRWMDRFLTLVFSEVMDFIHLLLKSLWMSVFLFKKTYIFFSYVRFCTNSVTSISKFRSKLSVFDFVCCLFLISWTTYSNLASVIVIVIHFF